MAEANLETCVTALQKVFRDGGGLLLLDGLDEVPEADQRRAQIKQVVESFARQYRHSRILVTSRTYAYQKQDWRLQGFAASELLPFSDGQIRRFVDSWYTHTADLRELKPKQAQARSEALKKAIFGRPRLHELGTRIL